MWILPRPLHTSGFVPDMAALSLDSTESSELCARSLFVRSKPSPARTWSQKWKRDSWTALLSGRILRPSHGQSFVTAWTSSLVATPASHSAQPVNDSAQKTLGTSGHLSQTEFGFSDPSSASLKMSKDISASDSEKSSESWEQSVIRRRGEYSARRSMREHLTSASGSSSWPSPIASEVRQGFQDRSRGMKGSQESLTTVVVKDAANWPTPAVMDTTGGSYKTEWKDGRAVSYHNHAQENPVAYGAKLSDAVKYGQAAPANPSTHGSRQGLWPTITAHTPDMESNGPNGHSGTYLAGAVKKHQKGDLWSTPRTGATESSRPNNKGGIPLADQAKREQGWRTPTSFDWKNTDCSTQVYLSDQVEGRTQKQWATPIQGDSHLASTPEVAQKRLEEGKVTLSRQMAAQWATPNAFCFQPPENTEQWTKRAEFQQTEKGVNLHKPIQTQVLHEVEKQWGTPTARDHKSGRGNEEREYKELTPMVERTQSGKLNPRWVETLMGLPVGWTMPSCASPVTIALTNCDSSATESCQPPQNELF